MTKDKILHQVVFTPQDGKRWMAGGDACISFQDDVRNVSDVLECKKMRLGRFCWGILQHVPMVKFLRCFLHVLL